MSRKEEIIKTKSMMKDVIIEWCQSSTAHAIPNIFRTNNIVLQIIWLFCFLTSAAYCLYSLVVTIQAYLIYPTYITNTIISETPTNFPAVTICNVRHTKLETILQERLKNVYYVNGTPAIKLSDFESFFDYINTDLYYIQLKLYDIYNNLTDNIKSNNSNFSDILLNCAFTWKQCTANDFNHFYHSSYGNCYTFNSGVFINGTEAPIKKVAVQGLDYGLFLELFLGDQNTSVLGDFNNGLIVSIHNQSSKPLMASDRIQIAKATETDLKIQRNFISRLDSPYGNCRKESKKHPKFNAEFFDHIVNTLNATYSQQYCFLLCLQSRIINSCNCSLGWLPAYKNKKICETIDESKCFSEEFIEFNEKGRSKECAEPCPVECDSIEYLITKSTSAFPTNYYKDRLFQLPQITLSGISYQDIDKSVLRLNIYYETMTYNSIIEVSAISPEMFFSNLGGTLGLYLGISILSVIEVFELIFKLIEVCLINRRRM